MSPASGKRSYRSNLLVALKALLGERQVTRAARQLGLSQSATGHALARLRARRGDSSQLPQPVKSIVARY
jgi:hypothetical protein